MLFIAVFYCFAAKAQQPLSTAIKTQAIDMGKALINNDIASFQKYMHPNVIEASGGAEKIKSIMDTAFKMFKTFGGQIKKITYGNPGEIVSHKKELQAVFPQSTEVSTSFADITLESTFIAISYDKGKNWYFIDANMYKSALLKDKLPELSHKLIIPPQSQPKITPKQQQ
jgi:ketosteroid isomerase-like protein